ncbi:MAG: GNAT family N-acetyltransferase [Alphaproteobacteria bacterium]|nr:GNAT family N-acetyltransferase [Alphaproteobacteria bacterium]
MTVTPASAAERALVEGLFQFYVHDFSEFAAPGATAFEFDEAGRFAAYPHMASYWSDAERWPLLIRVEGRVAGFALVNSLSHCGESIERNMGEFFVARKYRRDGIASEAVRQIFELHPGRWEVAVAVRNLSAISFWPKAIARAPRVSNIERREQNDDRWRGPIWHFHASAPSA